MNVRRCPTRRVRQDATWKLHDASAGGDLAFPPPIVAGVSAPPDAATTTDARWHPWDAALRALAPPTAPHSTPAAIVEYWRAALVLCAPTPGLWRRAHVALIAAGAVAPGGALAEFVRMDEERGADDEYDDDDDAWLEAAASDMCWFVTPAAQGVWVGDAVLTPGSR